MTSREDLARKIAEAVRKFTSFEPTEGHVHTLDSVILPLLPEVGEGETPRNKLRAKALTMCSPIIEAWQNTEAEPEDRRSFREVCADMMAAFAESLAPRGAGGPRCPKCKSLALTHFNFNAKGL